jgi:hypothetical protein
VHGNVMHTRSLRDSNLDRQEIGRPDDHPVVSHEDLEPAGQDALRELGEVEGRGVAASASPESRGNEDQPITLVWGVLLTNCATSTFR